MKRFTLIALAVLFIAALGAGSAFADTYQVTAGYGVRVIEQGSCEQVGSITIEGQTSTDEFLDGTIITVELLGGARICRNVGAAYYFGGPGVIPTAQTTWNPATTSPDEGYDYYIEAVTGDDYFIIGITEDSDPGDRIVVGHEFDSFLCFNLQGTIYNPSDPNLQLVQVSYRDSLENTYSGDSYVATVKPQTISFGICATGKYADVSSQEFCWIPPAVQGQTAQCGYDPWDSACLFRFTDNSVGELDGTYEITVGKTAGAKAGIGFQTINIYYSTGGYYVPVVVTERRNAAGVVLNPADYGGFAQPPIEALYAETSQITVEADLAGPGTYFVGGQGYAHQGPGLCLFEPGDWYVDVYGRKIPCGHSFSNLNRLILHTTECHYGAYPQPYCLLFPFGAGSWMNGLVLDNPNSHDQVFTAYINEADGDLYVAQATLAAGTMAVDLVENIFTITSPDSTDSAPFDEDYWLQIYSDDDAFFGYMFIFDGTMANGYTPICCTPECLPN
ncbi:MAG: hypothetical protein JW896_05075 [Deltaproteobacteria bacterium]|nr:hypothetical protein [Deltaproteobacteria bacterium]